MEGNERTVGRLAFRPDLGFRQITLVRAWTGDGAPCFEVDGIVHRHPVTRPVTPGIAFRLIASGIRLVVRDRSTPIAAVSTW